MLQPVIPSLARLQLAYGALSKLQASGLAKADRAGKERLIKGHPRTQIDLHQER